ncbi:hypothetical protein DXN04_08330 [Chitinophaga silvisoli]|uniref:Uncharacterized protein n=1 Tax=Chitinophaga silvisoli TaxID=2291814 RepID=A0A3E1P5E1_9BACT|nr:hypothetical protein DXN04_08330 [Chitinophaga silvisoli]
MKVGTAVPQNWRSKGGSRTYRIGNYIFIVRRLKATKVVFFIGKIRGGEYGHCLHTKLYIYVL